MEHAAIRPRSRLSTSRSVYKSRGSTNWQPSYNAKANPVVIRLRVEDLQRSVVQDLLRASFEILKPGAAAWSERPRTGP